MKILSVRRGRLSLLVLGLCLVALVAAVGVQYGKSGQNVGRADRTNALQVVKPVTEQPVLANIDFFTEYRLERERIRSERSDILRETIRLAKSDDSRQKAQEAVLKLVVEKQRETEMENLIRARGFADALVFIRDNSVSAVIKAQSLTREDVLQIADTIGRVAGVRQEDITISAKP